MKKLKLKMYLSGAELLNREQMKQIMGGFIWDDGSGSGSGSGSGGSMPPPLVECTDPGTCDATTDNCGDHCLCSTLTIEGEGTSYYCG